jgi:RNA polymerase-binding protein DksA
LAKKKTTKKPAPKTKAPAKKPAPKKSSSKASTKKPAAKKPASKPSPKKATTKKAPSKKTESKKPTSKKPAPAKKADAAKPQTKTTKPAKAAATPPAPSKPGKGKSKAAAAPAPAHTPARGSVKPPKKTKAEQAADVKSEAETFAAAKAAAARLAALAGLRPIESRPFQDSAAEGESKRLTKSPLSKKELDHYRQLLLMKRAEILGDVESMEGEALLSGDRMSHTPSHMAEQGSDVSSQSLSLDIAATQRKLLGEIDAALRRIEDGTYGVCTVMGSAIGKARLDAKPWASLCIEAARRLERGAYAS